MISKRTFQSRIFKSLTVLTGLDKDEIADACVPFENSTFDRCHFIWDKFKSQNYTTLFAEDTGWLGLFNYFRGGFTKQPTDYYLPVDYRKNLMFCCWK